MKLGIMKISRLYLVFGLALLIQCAALDKDAAGVPPTVGVGEETHDQVYFGVKWTFGAGIGPVLGFRHATVNSNKDTQGADISISAKILGGFQMDKFRVKYFTGINTAQGELSIGYAFGKDPFVGGGVNLPFSNIGFDYPFSRATPLEVYFMVDTLDRYKRPQPTESCATGFQLVAGDCTAVVPSDQRLKRDIHLLATLDDGMKIYSFKYLWSDRNYVGVMAQDLLENSLWKDAVVTQANGFYAVDYAMLGLRMATFEEWESKGLASVRLDQKWALLN